MKKMIDISHHNEISDWEELKNACDLLCVRMGYGVSGVDKKYRNHLEEIEKHDIPYGIYLYSYAENADDAKKEMVRLVEGVCNINDCRFIAYDREEKRNNIGMNTEVIISALLEYESYAIDLPLLLYMDQNYFKSFSVPAREEMERIAYKWIARYNTIPPETLCDAWQFTSKYVIKNNTGVFDCSYITKSFYERIVKSNNRTELSDCERKLNAIKNILIGEGE